jgi:Ca2+-transporting ATPase
MVVTDDNFASIVAAVEEGRGIYDNIKKFIQYLLSCNTGEILVMFLASLFGWHTPLIAIQILWINLITDGLPALALGVDPITSDVMNRPPRPPSESIITKQSAFFMITQGTLIATGTLFAFAMARFVAGYTIEHARTIAFITLTFSELFRSYACRSNTESIFKIGIFSNKQLVLATVVSFILQIGVVYLPFFQEIFKTENLGIVELVLVILVASFPFWVTELIKAINKKTNFIQ